MNNAATSINVLFLVFNRPESTARVFEAIRAARPARLFVASDGARENRSDESKIVERVRFIATQVDWPCEVKLLFRDENLGCKLAVSSAISWFFESVTEGIILEDDCLPNNDFFQYSKELLEKYRYDERIGMICGTNLYNLNCILPQHDLEYSYYFGRVASIWGWATWKRVWDEYDVNISEWSKLKKSKVYKNNFTLRKWHFLCKLFDGVYLNKIDTWDFQLGFLLLKSGRLSITPNVNLVENIGFNSNATHTKNKYSHEGKNLAGAIDWPLMHPVGIFADKRKDDYLDLVYSSRIFRYFIIILRYIF